MRYHISVRPGFTLKVLLSIITALFVAHVMYLMTMFVYGYRFRSLFKLFNFNDEGNFPTFYAVMALFLAALLLFVVGILKRSHKLKDGNYWLALSGIFTFLAFDEAAEVHERLNHIVRPYLPEASYDFLFWAWVVPYAIFALIVAFSFIKFLVRLPRRTTILFVISGAIFVTGAIGLELFNSYFWYNQGAGSLGLHMAFTLEELLEKIGIAFFIFAILDYIKNNMGKELVFGINNNIAMQADLKSKPSKNVIADEDTVLHGIKTK